MPRPLRSGDKVRFVSPASTPDRDDVLGAAAILQNWGLAVDFGEHAFAKLNYLAGTDEQRLSDFNLALRDPTIHAIFATCGGKGSYRIADQLDFAAARNDPKFVVGFSDISILHMALFRHGIGGGIHGAIQGDERDGPSSPAAVSLKDLLLLGDDVTLRGRANEATATLTTSGHAEGPLVGGNLDMVATAAGWALPKLDGCILLLEAVNMFLGQVDRHLSMLGKAGHLAGVAGIALGQFTDFKTSGSLTILDLLREHLAPLGVPILGGLPLGHGDGAASLPLGYRTRLDADRAELTVFRSAGGSVAHGPCI